MGGSFAALSVAVASAEGSGQEGADRFVPSLVVRSGVLVQEWDATVESRICRGCTFPDPAAEPLRPPDTGSDRDITPYVGAGLELMSPELPIPGSPRLFVGGEFAAAFGTERKVAREGDPGPIGNPNVEAAVFATFTEDNATGQGQETLVNVDHFTYGAHAGIAVPLEVFGRGLRIKPSFAWIRYEVEAEGIVSDAECTQFSPVNSQCNPISFVNPGFLRGVALRAETSDTYDGIGPGLDIEMDTGRIGPLGSSLLVGGRFYKILGDRSVEFRASPLTVSDSLGTDTYDARFGYEVDEWIYRVGVGFRLQWLGFGD